MTIKTQVSSDKPTSIRDSISSAMTEVSENMKKAEAENKKDEVEEKEIKEPDKVEETQEEKEVSSEEKEDTSEEKEVKEEVEEKEEKVSAPKEKKGGTQPIPYGLTKEIRGKWSDYDDETQQFITKLAKDANDSRAAAGRVNSELREVDAVLTPYKPSIQRAGVTAAQIVKKVLEYSDGLAGSNKYQVIQQIAHDFDIDLTRFGKPSKPTLGQNKEQTDDTDEITVDLPQHVHEKLDRILLGHEQNALAQSEAQKRAMQKAAEDTVHAWSGFNAATGNHDKKQFFPYVRHSMTALMNSNPERYLDGNNLNLDKAYDDACYADPEIREIMLENAKLEKQKQTQAAREKKAKEIAAAKAKNISLKPSASSIGSASQTRNASNGKDRKGPVSVKESIMAAIQENR